MKLDQFALERMQSLYEHTVTYNLSESGVQPLTVGDLLDGPGERDALLAERLRYVQTNGSDDLREMIAGLYANATRAHIQITNGGSEANFVAIWHLLEPGDEMVLMVPNYMQTWGVARGFGASVIEWPLTRATSGWVADVGALARLVTPRTKIIAICNPNNPTGARFDAATLDAIATVAARHGSWILSDEIYRGAERDGRETSTMWGRYERTIVTSGLSKAYGLPGLRIGWVAGPPDIVAALWACHDYTTIAPGALSDALARRAIEPARREQILGRTRAILNRNYPVIAEWLDAQDGLFSYAPPDAGAIVYAQYHRAINSTALVTRLRVEKSVLIVPGDHFGMDGYLRIGYGEDTDYLQRGLERVRELLCSI